jgi:Calcineurin-like phosphoesterase
LIRRFTFTMAALLLALLAAAQACAEQWRFDGVERIVAMSDIHGAYDHFTATLKSAGVVDDALSWVGGKTHLVIVGDMLDRGPRSRDVMDLLMRLETEAADAGGMVHVLIGNHEAMNLVGDLRYVSPEEYAAFAQDERPEDRERWKAAYIARQTAEEKTPDELGEEFDRQFPAGYFGKWREFGSAGKYGGWLLGKPIIIVIDGTAFVHGGLSPVVTRLGLDGVNGQLHDDLVEYVHQLETLVEAGVLLPTDNFYRQPKLVAGFTPGLNADIKVVNAAAALQHLYDSDVHAVDGPLWYRGNVSCSVLIESDKLDSALAALDAKRVVIGHTPTMNRRVLERMHDEVIEIDTGMLSSYYNGSGNALVIEGDRITAVNEANPEGVAPMAQPRQVGRRPGGFLDADRVEGLLAHGDIVSNSRDESGQQIVSVSDGERTIDGVFTKRAGRGFYPQIAAYRLDRMLALGMVPVTVRRNVDGADGSLQFRPAGAIDEVQRHEKGYGADAQCPLQEQWGAMFVFDALTYNDGRYATTILYSPDTWQLMLVGYDKAFSTSAGRPPQLVSQELALGMRWRQALGSLTDDKLTVRLGDVLDARRLHALEKRRDELLEQH